MTSIANNHHLYDYTGFISRLDLTLDCCAVRVLVVVVVLLSTSPSTGARICRLCFYGQFARLALAVWRMKKIDFALRYCLWLSACITHPFNPSSPIPPIQMQPFGCWNFAVLLFPCINASPNRARIIILLCSGLIVQRHHLPYLHCLLLSVGRIQFRLAKGGERGVVLLGISLKTKSRLLHFNYGSWHCRVCEGRNKSEETERMEMSYFVQTVH